MSARVLALDFGASSARAMLGVLDRQALSVTEIHRWENVPVTIDGHLCWDIGMLFGEVKHALQKAHAAGGFDSVGVDTWGVDFGLIGTDGMLLENPVHYRDKRTEGMLEEAFSKIAPRRFYEVTGNQFMPINTAFQLLSLVKKRPALLEKAQALLMMPDLFAYLLTGETGAEYTICSTTQLLDCASRTWSDSVLRGLGIPPQLFCPIEPPGSVRGRLLPALCEELQIPSVPVIAVASHDTASAVAATAHKNPDFVFISSGTWSLVGTVIDHPVTDIRAFEYNLTNEGGYGGSIRFLKNLTGLWLVQEARRQWKREGKQYSFDALDTMAARASDIFRIDTQSPALAQPGNIPQRIAEQCHMAGAPVPKTPGEIIRCIYESLADAYAETIRELSVCTGKSFSEIHIVGGGARGTLLPQITADRTGCTVYTGPVEATVLGNIAVQLIAAGAVPTLSAAQALIEANEAPHIFQCRHKNP